jgi:Na+-translocating ferredoxin:NAD+ oxidoreductase RnfD subunit
MVIWLVALALFAAWFVATVFFGKGGFIHILLLNAIAVAVVQFVHDRRAARQ